MNSFLQVILPLAACGLSLLAISLRVTYRYAASRKGVAYRVLEPAQDDTQDGQPVQEEGDPLLAKVTDPGESRMEVNRPRGELTVLILEIIALLGEVSVFITILSTNTWGRYGTVPAAAKLVSWSYILFLVLVRLLLSAMELHPLPRIWNHTAALYALQWLFTVFVFRSSIIHPLSRNALVMSVVEFSLSTILLLIALVTRRGNKAVLLQHEDGLEPPRHPIASLLSLGTFSWLDPLILKGYRQALELEDVWNLTLSQKAAVVLDDFRRQEMTGGLAWKLLRYFYGTILLQGAWTVFSNLFTFLPTLLMQAILQYVEDPRSTTANAAWLFAILLFVCGAVQGIADAQALWIGRKLGVKLRAIIIGELYAKALRRKAGAGPESAKEETKSGKHNKTRSSGGKDDPENANGKQSDPMEAGETHQANIGTIINLMAIDSFKVSEVGAYLHFLWASVPVQVTIAIVLLYRILGFSSFAGIVLMALMLPVNMLIAKRFQTVQNQILTGTDARIHATNEILQNIRIIKYFAWEQRFEDIVNEKRRAELKALRNRYIIWSTAATVWYGTPIIITFMSFFLYTVVEKKDLTPSIAFPALSMFSLLRVPLDQLADMIAHVQESKVSLDRVDRYLNEEETEKYDQISDNNVTGEPPRIALDKATLTWGSSKLGAQGGLSEAFRLIDMDVDFHIGKLNIIAGATGSGKTSLLMALLGEMRLLQGRVHLPGGTTNRVELPVDPQTGLIDSIAYCAQEAWLVNDTVKENIVFASPFDKRRYRAVIKACALERDLEILNAGDQTMVGEKGISLSGGQKQRISLARAVYSKSAHILLDDCLSAVDSHTAKHIFREALMGPLMINRTCVLVTHNVALTAPQASHVVVLDNGKISAQGHPDAVAASGALGDELYKSRPTSRSNSQRISRVPSNLEELHEHVPDEDTSRLNDVSNGTANGPNGHKADGHRPKLTEGKATGSINWSTISMYLRYMGRWHYWIVAVLVFALQQVGSISTNIWIRQWANAYNNRAASLEDTQKYTAVTNLKLPSFNVGSVPRSSGWSAPQLSTRSTAEVLGEVNVAYYLWVYALLGATYILISLAREGVMFWGSLHASRNIHKRLLNAIMHANFRFFDSTPLGQLMNRFSKDVEAVDQEVAPVAVGMLHCFASVLVVVILISAITPGFLVAGVFITIVYTAIGAFYLNSSRDLKRLESVQRSPLYQQFGETLTGIITIRAYGDGPRFVVDNHRRINAYNRPHIYLWASNRWLAFRVDITGALVSFFAAAFVLINVGRIDAGAAGLSLTYAVTFTENVLWLVRLYSEVQQNMNSVERVKEYLEVDQEAQAVIPDSRPPTKWPSRGAVEFVDYLTRYRSDLDPVLRNVSFAVSPGEKVGIVGRTGAGKSSLALALFRGLEAEEGEIIIDDVDIGSIGLRDLREAITIVPQDPTLFTGTIRSNLDPFGLSTDEEIFTALRRVHLIGPGTSGTTTPTTTRVVAPGESPSTPSSSNINSSTMTITDNRNIFRDLQTPVAESGSNLSQGQRQLLCLARALLKNPRVLMMDEATASIDYATDGKIQETLRELKESTIITIAHRLQTIIDYDKVLVLDHGKVIEYDHPWTLISKEDGLFHSMCEHSGNVEALVEGARRAWEQKRLVDDS